MGTPFRKGRLIIKSKEVKENHLTIIIRANNQQDADYIEKEFRAMVHRIWNCTELDVSFEMFKNIKRV